MGLGLGLSLGALGLAALFYGATAATTSRALAQPEPRRRRPDGSDDVQLGAVAPTAQETPWTCGPAALRAVLAHHGRHLPESKASVTVGCRPIYGVGSDGIIAGAKQLGFGAVVLPPVTGVAALRPLTQAGMPVMAVVDSFTRPGERSHWIVVTDVGDDGVRIMDPHTPGNWRVLSPAEFDARWWSRKLDPCTGQTVRVDHVGVLVAPPQTVAVGAAPAHGRVAKCPTGNGFFGGVLNVWTKGLTYGFNVLVPGSGKLIGPLADQAIAATRNLKGAELSKWINDASNPEVTLWAVARLKDMVARHLADDGTALDAMGRGLVKYDVSAADFTGTAEQAASAVLRWSLANFKSINSCATQHAMQAVAIQYYGGPDVMPVLLGALKSLRGRVGSSAYVAGCQTVVKTLEAFRDARQPQTEV